MLGWMIVFAMIAVLAPITALTGNQTLASQIGGALFAALFFIGLATRLARGRVA